MIAVGRGQPKIRVVSRAARLVEPAPVCRSCGILDVVSTEDQYMSFTGRIHVGNCGVIEERVTACGEDRLGTSSPVEAPHRSVQVDDGVLMLGRRVGSSVIYAPTDQHDAPRDKGGVFGHRFNELTGVRGPACFSELARAEVKPVVIDAARLGGGDTARSGRDRAGFSSDHVQCGSELDKGAVGPGRG